MRGAIQFLLGRDELDGLTILLGQRLFNVLAIIGAQASHGHGGEAAIVFQQANLVWHNDNQTAVTSKVPVLSRHVRTSVPSSEPSAASVIAAIGCAGALVSATASTAGCSVAAGVNRSLRSSVAADAGSLTLNSLAGSTDSEPNRSRGS